MAKQKSIVNLNALASLQSLLNLLPRRCRVCEGVSRSRCNLCDDCVAAFPAPTQLCPQCAEAMPAAANICTACETQAPAFARTEVAWQWAWPQSQLLKRFKFDQQRAVGKDLATVFARKMAPRIQALDTDMNYVMAMPLHRQRLRQRGYNQAAILAAPLAKACGLEIHCPVERIINTPAQSGLTRSQRLKNLRGAFSVTKPALVKGANILLVDDVMTTGSSAQSVAEVLINAGAKSVTVCVLCKVE